MAFPLPLSLFPFEVNEIPLSFRFRQELPVAAGHLELRPIEASPFLLPVDIEYVTWAHPGSEIIHF